MGRPAGAHLRGMMTDLHLGTALLVLTASLTLLGCDAPKKSVGQESESSG